MLKRWNFLKTGFYEGIKIDSPQCPQYALAVKRIIIILPLLGLVALSFAVCAQSETSTDQDAPGKVTLEVPNTAAGETVVLELSQGKILETGVSRLRVKALEDIPSARIRLEKLVANPKSIEPHSDAIYSYLEIEAPAVDELSFDQIAIEFVVPLRWINEH